MRFFQVVLSGAALVAAALAVEFTSTPTSVESGKSYTLTYTPKDASVTIKLRKGNSNNLDTIGTLGTGSGGTFQWTVSADLPNGSDYAFEIDQEGQPPNYSGQFSLTGSKAAASSSGSATPTAISTTQASSTEISTTVKTTVSTLATTASAKVSSTAGTNSTVISATLSKTATATAAGTSASGTHASATGGSAPPNSTGAASMLGSSPVALLFGAVAAMAYL